MVKEMVVVVPMHGFLKEVTKMSKKLQKPIQKNEIEMVLYGEGNGCNS